MILASVDIALSQTRRYAPGFGTGTRTGKLHGNRKAFLMGMITLLVMFGQSYLTNTLTANACHIRIEYHYAPVLHTIIHLIYIYIYIYIQLYEISYSIRSNPSNQVLFHLNIDYVGVECIALNTFNE